MPSWLCVEFAMCRVVPQSVKVLEFLYLSFEALRTLFPNHWMDFVHIQYF